MRYVPYIQLLLVWFILCNNIYAQDLEGIPHKGTVEYEAKIFLLKLGEGDFAYCYNHLTSHSKRRIVKGAIDRFSDLDNKNYFYNEMDYLLQTDVEGHRSVYFEDLRYAYCKKLGIKPKDLPKVRVKLKSKRDFERAEVLFYLGRKKGILVMKKEFGVWKAAWYPPLVKEAPLKL